MGTVTSTKVILPSLAGEVYRSGVNESFSTIRSGAGTDVDTTEGEVALASNSTTNQYGLLVRTIILFDTSVLPANASITSANIGVQANTVATNLGTTTMELVSSNPASTSVLATSDYSTLGSTSFSSVALGSISTSSSTTFTLNASGISNISIGSISKFGFILGWDLNNNFTGTWASINSTTVFWKPITNLGFGTLTVTYTQPTLAITGIGSTISNINTITTS